MEDIPDIIGYLLIASPLGGILIALAILEEWNIGGLLCSFVQALRDLSIILLGVSIGLTVMWMGIQIIKH